MVNTLIKFGKKYQTLDEGILDEVFGIRFDREKLVMSLQIKKKNPFALVGDSIVLLAARCFCIHNDKDFKSIGNEKLVSNLRMKEYLTRWGCIEEIEFHDHYCGTIFETLICLYSQNWLFFDGLVKTVEKINEIFYNNQLVLNMETLAYYSWSNSYPINELYELIGKSVFDIICRQMYKYELFERASIDLEVPLETTLKNFNHIRFRNEFLCDQNLPDPIDLGKLFVQSKFSIIDKLLFNCN